MSYHIKLLSYIYIYTISQNQISKISKLKLYIPS